MAVYDDPMFSKALKLLHSPARDATYQLMKLFEEVITQKYGGSKTLNPKFHNLTEESSFLEIPKLRGSRGPSPALLGPSEKSSRSSTPPSEPVSIRTSPDRDEGDLALEIFEDDLFCTVCKGMHVTSDNRLLECNDCHSLYHQDCHKPPIENDAVDARLIWTCGDCTKKAQDKLLKSKTSESSSKKHKSDNEKSSSSSKRPKDSDLESAPKRHKSDNDRSETESRKSEKERSNSHKSSSQSGAKHSSSSSSSSSSSKSESKSSKSSRSSPSLTFNKAPGSPNGKGPACSTNIIAADKRLQNMKKKAAAKMQEKRSIK